MAVRLEVELRALKGAKKDEKIRTRALLNAGYESEHKIVIPATIAEKLGFLLPCYQKLS